MKFNDIINEWLGKKVGDGECVIWAAQFTCEAYGVCYLPTPVTGGARDIYEQFPNPLPQTFNRVPVGGVPPQGSLVIWGEGLGNYYGHIAVASGEGNASTFISYDSNWSGKTVQRIQHNYNNVLGYLIPKQGDQMTAEEGRRLQAVEENIRALNSFDINGRLERLEVSLRDIRDVQIPAILKAIKEINPEAKIEPVDSLLKRIIDYFKK